MSWEEDMGIGCGINGETLLAIKEIKSHIKELKEELIRRKIYPFAEPSDFIWETKDGKKIPVGEMEESHIINCIKLCEKKIKEIEEYFGIHYDDEDIIFMSHNFIDVEVEDNENN